jgi:butyryl-CoA dehydrogenase
VKPAVDAFSKPASSMPRAVSKRAACNLPTLLSQACFAHFQSANAASTSYPFLTMGAANLIESFGTDEQKRASCNR